MMVILTLLNGIIFFKKLIKLQQETNQLLLKILAKNKNVKKSDAMSSEELEKIKHEYLKNMK
jgi:Mg2+/Co2+ transporter CorB